MREPVLLVLSVYQILWSAPSNMFFANLPQNPRWGYYYPYFTDTKIEAQKVCKVAENLRAINN